MKTCPTCGRKFDERLRRCPDCGTQLVSQAPRHFKESEKGDARPRRRWPWVIAALILAVAASVACVVVLQPQKASKPAELQAEQANKTTQESMQVTEPLAEAEASAEPAEPAPSGWVTDDDGSRRYFDPDTHEPHEGWLELDGNTYYLASDGSPTTGWAEVDELRRFFDDDGVMCTGLVTDDTGTSYWIDPETGKLASHEWVEVDGIYQAFDDDGSLVTLGDVIPPDDEANLAAMGYRQQQVLDACKVTPWPGKALCAGWVSSVFVNAGEPAVEGDACDIARAWCYSDNLAELKPGMLIAVSTHPRTENGRIWGHVCIYVGNGHIMDSGTYGIRTSSLGSWLAWFGASETPRWGWANGIDLSQG